METEDGRDNGEKMNPIRIQRQRIKGWRMPANTVSVGRPSRWGNPFRVGGMFHLSMIGPDPFFQIRSPAQAVDLYHKMIERPDRAEFRAAVKAELRGRNLACWCALDDAAGNRVPCHADVLLEIANAD